LVVESYFEGDGYYFLKSCISSINVFLLEDGFAIRGAECLFFKGESYCPGPGNLEI
jgi:hypothetical protein